MSNKKRKLKHALKTTVAPQIDQTSQGFQKPQTLFEMFSHVDKKEYVLPSIQRKFVWEEKDITKLFDSLMLGYPIGSFLISHCITNNCLTTKFYKCLQSRDYNNAVDNNESMSYAQCKESFLLLDGQQRLTSIYIGLNGSIIKNKTKEKRVLCLNYGKKPNLNTTSFNKVSYEFEFMSENKAEEKNMFIVANILAYENKLNQLLADRCKNDIEKENLTRLYKVVFEDKNLLVYKLDDKCSLYDILSVFDRLNSSGTPLSNSNLIFSVLVSYWPDARNKIDGLLERINSFDFQFTEEYIIKFALIAKGLDPALKLEKFSEKDAKEIQTQWNLIQHSIYLTMQLLSEAYYMNSNYILAENAVLPINYLIYLRLCEKCKNVKTKEVTEIKYTDLISKKIQNNIDEIYEIRKVFVLFQMKKLFQSGSDKVAKSLCDFIKKKEENKWDKNKFLTHEAFKEWGFNDRNIIVDTDFIDSLFLLTKGGSRTFLVLSLLYPKISIKASEKHQDHLHPEKLFKGRQLRKTFPKATAKDLEFYKQEYNCLANLHFLDGAVNSGEKNDKFLQDWLHESIANVTNVVCLPFEEEILIKQNYDKHNVLNFQEFIKERKRLMTEEFKKIFNV